MQRAEKLFWLAIPSAQVIQKMMAIERQTLTSTKTDSDAEKVKERAPCYNYIGWLQYVGAHLLWQDSHTAFI